MLYSNGVRLRAIDRPDLPLFVDWFNDPEVRSGLAICLPMSGVQEENWFARVLQGPAEEFPLMIEIPDQENWKPIGSCGFKQIDWRNRSATLGISIGDKASWNQGHGTETMELLLDHGFGTLNLHRIWLQVYRGNPRAIRCYEKAGFIHEGCFREAHYRDGKYEDALIMSVLKPEWQKRRRSIVNE
jgi:RimJ/RimL family protein N-acetyltransferase